jgi:hypothetical protein
MIGTNSWAGSDILPWLLKWTPRAFFAALGGYYSLGVAYGTGVMARIDVLAIKILKHFSGYAGVGAGMPIVQSYAAWGVRFVGAALCVWLYILVEKILCFVYAKIFGSRQLEQGKDTNQRSKLCNSLEINS